ncbi:MAG: hypothetical protein ACYCSG_00090 [Thermoplasmataceae archaeon]
MTVNEPEFSYLLGMLIGKGNIKRVSNEIYFIIEIPHKNLRINGREASLYVSASILNIKNYLESYIGTTIRTEVQNHRTLLSFYKPDSEMISREVLNMLKNMPNYKEMRIPTEVFEMQSALQIEFLRGVADVTGHIRESNAAYGDQSGNRVYLEIPENWMLVIDLANLLRKIDVPVQDIDWAHPNFRDSNLKQYNMGNKYFWKKEHQLKIYADEFEKVGFIIRHKAERLRELAAENRAEWLRHSHRNGRTLEEAHHRFYWQTHGSNKQRPKHPMESDEFIPEHIRGVHFDSWKDVAAMLGYGDS